MTEETRPDPRDRPHGVWLFLLSDVHTLWFPARSLRDRAARSQTPCFGLYIARSALKFSTPRQPNRHGVFAGLDRRYVCSGQISGGDGGRRRRPEAWRLWFARQQRGVRADGPLRRLRRPSAAPVRGDGRDATAEERAAVRCFDDEPARARVFARTHALLAQKSAADDLLRPQPLCRPVRPARITKAMSAAAAGHRQACCSSSLGRQVPRQARRPLRRPAREGRLVAVALCRKDEISLMRQELFYLKNRAPRGSKNASRFFEL